MIITNKYNLPNALVDYIKDKEYKPTEKHYSATTIINSPRYILLQRRHNAEIEQDCSEFINMLLGTATHKILEDFDKTGFAELRVEEPIKDDYILTGVIDLLDVDDNAIVDWKTGTVTKILKGDFKDWKKQGLIYAWVAIKKGYYIDKLKFHVLLKDWTAREKRIADLKGEFYPEAQVYTWLHNVTTQDLIDIENYIRDKFEELIRCEKLSDDDLPDCEDTWFTGEKWAVHYLDKDGKPKQKAWRVFDTEEEAKKLFKQGENVIIHREGEHRRCQDYCPVCKFCKYYEARKPKEEK